jgi:hypothetical protein
MLRHYRFRPESYQFTIHSQSFTLSRIILFETLTDLDIIVGGTR